jgi:hypothetical protein
MQINFIIRRDGANVLTLSKDSLATVGSLKYEVLHTLFKWGVLDPAKPYDLVKEDRRLPEGARLSTLIEIGWVPVAIDILDRLDEASQQSLDRLTNKPTADTVGSRDDHADDGNS